MEPQTNTPAFGLRLICNEPFRVFFPLGIVCGLIGVSHWLLYYVGWVAQYSCFYHGLIQIQGFLTCFIVGFLMTALPKFLEVPAARPHEIFLNIALVMVILIGLVRENRTTAEIGFLALILHTILFAAKRFRKRKDLPPTEFVFILFGFLFAMTGGLMLLSPATTATGRRLIEQGMPLSFIMAIGGFLIPLLLGYRPRAPRDASSEAIRQTVEPMQRIRITLYLLTGGLLLFSFIVESLLSGPAGKLLRAAVVSAYLLWVVKIHRRPLSNLWHIRFIRLSLYLVMSGLYLSGFFPDYDIMALHLLFIGGFSMIALSIGTRVVVSHCGFEPLWNRNLAAVVIFGIFFLIALGLRLSADLYPDAYFLLVAFASGFWLIGVFVWGVYFVPKMRFVDTSE
jgi:uncharacterized protein involved in response to NO